MAYNLGRSGDRLRGLSFENQINEFMIYCRSTQLRPKTMWSYDQTLRLFERWCEEKLGIVTVDRVSETVIRRYINDLQERGKYSFYADDSKKQINYPERRRDFRKPISVVTINSYIRQMRVFFNWLDREYIITKNPMIKVRQLKMNRVAFRRGNIQFVQLQVDIYRVIGHFSGQ